MILIGAYSIPTRLSALSQARSQVRVSEPAAGPQGMGGRPAGPPPPRKPLSCIFPTARMGGRPDGRKLPVSELETAGRAEARAPVPGQGRGGPGRAHAAKPRRAGAGAQPWAALDRVTAPGHGSYVDGGLQTSAWCSYEHTYHAEWIVIRCKQHNLKRCLDQRKRHTIVATKTRLKARRRSGTRATRDKVGATISPDGWNDARRRPILILWHHLELPLRS